MSQSRETPLSPSLAAMQSIPPVSSLGLYWCFLLLAEPPLHLQNIAAETGSAATCMSIGNMSARFVTVARLSGNKGLMLLTIPIPSRGIYVGMIGLRSLCRPS